MTWRPPHHVAWVRVDGVTYVADVFRGQILVLEGSAALIWEAALRGETTTLVARVTEDGAADLQAVQHEVDSFLADLIERGMLTSQEAG